MTIIKQTLLSVTRHLSCCSPFKLAESHISCMRPAVPTGSCCVNDATGECQETCTEDGCVSTRLSSIAPLFLSHLALSLSRSHLFRVPHPSSLISPSPCSPFPSIVVVRALGVLTFLCSTNVNMLRLQDLLSGAWVAGGTCETECRKFPVLRSVS